MENARSRNTGGWNCNIYKEIEWQKMAFTWRAPTGAGGNRGTFHVEQNAPSIANRCLFHVEHTAAVKRAARLQRPFVPYWG